jgi:hypothetical protein
MEGDDNVAYHHVVLQLKAASTKLDLPSSSDSHGTKCVRLIDGANYRGYIEDIRLAPSEASALALARCKVAGLHPEHPDTLIMVAKITHATKLVEEPLPTPGVVDRATEGVNVQDSSKHARWLVTFIKETATPAKIPKHVTSDITGRLIEWANTPDGLTSAVVLAATQAEAEQLAYEIKQKNPQWQAVISRVTSQISAGITKKRTFLQLAQV